MCARTAHPTLDVPKYISTFQNETDVLATPAPVFVTLITARNANAAILGGIGSRNLNVPRP